MSLNTTAFATAYAPMTTDTVGYTCDGSNAYGFPCTSKVTLGQYNSRGGSLGTGWTFSRDGRAYCPACGPERNAPHKCPPPPPPAPEPPALTRADTFDFAADVVITYWHVDERKVRTWRVRQPLVGPAADGVHVLKWDIKAGTFREHVIVWPVIISIAGEGVQFGGQS